MRSKLKTLQACPTSKPLTGYLDHLAAPYRRQVPAPLATHLDFLMIASFRPTETLLLSTVPRTKRFPGPPPIVLGFYFLFYHIMHLLVYTLVSTQLGSRALVNNYKMFIYLFNKYGSPLPRAETGSMLNFSNSCT